MPDLLQYAVIHELIMFSSVSYLYKHATHIPPARTLGLGRHLRQPKS